MALISLNDRKQHNAVNSVSISKNLKKGHDKILNKILGSASEGKLVYSGESDWILYIKLVLNCQLKFIS